MSTQQRLIAPERKVILLKEDGTWEYEKPTASVIEKWKSLALPKSIVGWFQGLFDRLGVRIIDTGEEFTCVHAGERIEFEKGIDVASVDLTVEMYAFQADRLAGEVATGEIGEREQFRIVRELFGAGSAGRRNIRYNPLMSSSLLRWLIRGKKLLHIYLVSPDPTKGQDAVFTMVFASRHWLVIPGTWGKPERVFKVSVMNALELQKRFFVGMKSGRFWDWLQIARWYVNWRRKVEVTV